MITPLYIKTNYSLLSSMIKIDDLVKYAKKNNYESLTITDNNMYGVMEFYNACKSNDIKPIVGLEIKIENKFLVLYAINYTGYKNLLKISTIQSENVLDIEILNKYNSNLIAIVPFDSLEIYDKITFKYKFKSYENETQRSVLKDTNIVFMIDILYLEENDANYINYLYGIKDGTTIDKVNLDKKKNFLNIYQIDKRYENDLKNNALITNMCNLEIIKEENLLPVYDCPNNMDSYTYLKELCKQGLKRIFGNTVSKIYIDRLKYELEVINSMGFCNYFLVVYDYVKYAKDNNILVGPGRGSAAGSLVSYLLNITTIDPIKYNLLFERFLNKERVTMPDIDIDFDDQKRDEIINYCINKYGRKKVAPIITYGTLAAKQAIRDVGRVMAVDLKVIDYICKLIDSKLSLIDNYKNIKLKEYLNSDNELMKLYKIAIKFEKLKRHTSIHAAGVVICNVDLDEIIPLDCTHEFYLTGYSMEYLESLGLLKMDFLSLSNLSLVSDCLKELKMDLDDIPLNDAKAISIFTNVYTVGIFQFESTGMMNFLRKFKPINFEDIVAAISLFRPGPMDNIDMYIKRRKGLEKIDYIDPTLEKILKPTYGIIIYQEQIMQIASIIAGYSYSEADILRRAMSKKKESVMLSLKDEFILRSEKLGYKKELATTVYNLILKFANYGFNRAHSVAYSMLAYKMAYLKANYPLIFMKNLMTMNIGSSEKTKEYIYECKLHNLKVLKPNINLSDMYYVVYEDGIIYPFTNIKNVGVNGARFIIEERNKTKFINIFDFVKRCYGKSITKKTLESLIYAGCFNEYNKKTLINNLDLIINYGEIGGLLENEDLMPELIIYEEFSKKELMGYELDVIGFYLSDNPVTEYKLKYNSVNIKEIPNYFDKDINIVICVDRIKEIKTKNNQTMAFITGSDEISNIDIVLFSNIYKDLKIENNDIFLIHGRVEKRFDKYQIIADDVKQIN